MTENAPASIEIVAVDPSQGLGDTFSVIVGDNQSLENTAILGAIVRDADGNVLREAVVSVDAGDQSVSLNGTGTFWGEPHNVYYYPLNYTFHSAGDHIITFTAGVATGSVTLKAE